MGIVAVGSVRIDFNEVDPEGPRGSRVCDFSGGRMVRVLCRFQQWVVATVTVELAVVRAVGVVRFDGDEDVRVRGSRACDFFNSRGTSVLPCFPREVVVVVVVAVGLAVVQAVGTVRLRGVGAAGVGSRA